MNKTVSEIYLIDAMSFTEAEMRINEEIAPYVNGDFMTSTIKRANYAELVPSAEETDYRWFKCKLLFVTLDEKTAAERFTATHILVQAADLRDAIHKLDAHMKDTMADYQIAAVSETAIMDVMLMGE